MRFPVPRRASHHWCALLVAGAWTAAVSFGSARDASAQLSRPPDAGGRTASLGQPLLWHWQATLGTGLYLGDGSGDVMVRAVAGTYYAPLNPVTKLAELGVEAYVGARGNKADGGVRGLLQVPYFSAGVGADYNVRDNRLDMLVTLHTPVRRGGFATRADAERAS